MPVIVVSNLWSNYFWAVGIVLQSIGWIIQVAGLSAIANNWNTKFGESHVLGLGWWALFLQLGILLGIMATIMATSATNFQPSLFHYRITFIALITLALANMFNCAQDVRNVAGTRPDSGIDTYLAGVVINGMIWIVWILALGSEPNSLIAQLVYVRLASGNSAPFAPTFMNNRAMGTDAKLTLTTPPSQAVDNNLRSVATDRGQASSMISGAEDSFDLRAEALYSYTRNPEDPSEISFDKGERFIVIDNKGKWWKVRKEDGSVGIAPSNYLELKS